MTIKLPPLPDLGPEWTAHLANRVHGQMQSYALAAIEAYKQQQGEASKATRPANSQQWKGMTGSCAFLLIQRHADDWDDIELMMGEWLAANAAPAPGHGIGGEK